MGGHLSGGLAVNGEGLGGLLPALLSRKAAGQGEAVMMNRFCRYIEKVFDFGSRMAQLKDLRQRPRSMAGVAGVRSCNITFLWFGCGGFPLA